MQLPLGIDDFGKIIVNKINFVDKSLFIKEIIDDKVTEVAVITRPRRFGKTLNLSMLQHFLAAEVNRLPTKGMFDNLKIAQVEQGDYILKHQGQYPVIFITLKDIKNNNFETAYDNMRELIIAVYDKHNYLKNSDKLTDNQKELYRLILNRKADESQLQGSLRTLSECLYAHYGKKVYLLIDEYDTPLQTAYSRDYYDKMVDFIRNMFGTTLKGNPSIEKAVITGILRIARESLFSDLNNVKVYSLFHSKYSQYFGFTEDEVKALLIQANLEDQAEAVKNWYNGYKMGDTIIYNPWSIANFINDRKIDTYWLNTSSNQLVKDLIIQSKDHFKSKIEDLLGGKPIECVINENMVFGDLSTSSEATVWSLLLLSGYLKVLRQYEVNGRLTGLLDIPNYEVRSIYRQIIETWLVNNQDTQDYDRLLDYLLTGQIEQFREYFALFIEQTTSYHDYGNEPEAFYHGLLIGLTATLYGNANYEITSNRESGFGRYDYFIYSKDHTKPTIIFELKRLRFATSKEAESISDEKLNVLLSNIAHEAINQITAQHYTAEARRLGAVNIIKLGLGFYGKHFVLENEKVDLTKS